MRNIFFKRIFLPLVFMFLFSANSPAQDASGISNSLLNDFLVGVVIFLLLVCIALAFIVMQVSSHLRHAKKANPALKQVTGLRQWWNNLDKKFFTKAAPLEKEADVLLDHNYDGIKELDNALPPWWKWGFYITLIVAVFYMFRFHVWKTGPTPEEEYNKEMTVALARLENIRMNSKLMFDEKTVTLADAAGITDGKKLFSGTCVPCHGANGEGNAVGPNLTDKFWLHGGDLGNVFKTITIGVPDKGMQAWGKTFSPAEIKNLSSFILSLQGSNPANGKAPQGELYSPVAAKDSVNVKKDSVLPK